MGKTSALASSPSSKWRSTSRFGGLDRSVFEGDSRARRSRRKESEVDAPRPIENISFRKRAL